MVENCWNRRSHDEWDFATSAVRSDVFASLLSNLVAQNGEPGTRLKKTQSVLERARGKNMGACISKLSTQLKDQRRLVFEYKDPSFGRKNLHDQVPSTTNPLLHSIRISSFAYCQL